jgi:hypothetical protein
LVAPRLKLKGLFPSPDTKTMSKRGLYQLLATITLGLTYLVAAGASDDIGSRSFCVGLGSFPYWFDDACSAALVPRLLFMAVGAIPIVLLLYFGDKASEPKGKAGSTKHEVLLDPRDSMYWCKDCNFWSHDVKEARAHRGSFVDPAKTGLRPTQPVANTASSSAGAPKSRAGDRDQLKTAIASFRPSEQAKRGIRSPTFVAGGDFGFGDSVTKRAPKAPARSAPDLKTCPDCAEDVRPAARKCRFCGFVFEDQKTTA